MKCIKCNCESTNNDKVHWKDCPIRTGKHYIVFDGEILLDLNSTNMESRINIRDGELCILNGRVVATYGEFKKMKKCGHGMLDDLAGDYEFK